MLEIITPASTSNIGVGFDCFGLALDIVNRFQVDLSLETKLLNCDPEFNHSDNLFLQAYRKGLDYLKIDDHITVDFDCQIPISRGLGSSSTFIVGGLLAASYLHDQAIDQNTIFQLASQMEGHPDNIAPCLFGGFTASTILEDGTFITRKSNLSPNWLFTLFICDHQVSTHEAREILPESYLRSVVVSNSAKCVLLLEALKQGDQELLNQAGQDAIHEPYRKTLIPGFDKLKQIAEEDSGGHLFISGSGSTCLLIHQKELSKKAIETIESQPEKWSVRKTKPLDQGALVRKIHHE